MADKFAGVTLDREMIKHKSGTWPVAGAKATVDSAGEIDRRITATRVILTGGLGLFWRKKKDGRELYLMVEGPGYAFVEKVDPDKGQKAREFAAKINAAGSATSVR